MTFKEIQELIRQISRSNLAEFKVKNGDFELSIRTDRYERQKQQSLAGQVQQLSAPPAGLAQMPAAQQHYAHPASPASAAAVPAEGHSAGAEPKVVAVDPGAGQYAEVRSPIVGTFYRSSSPEKPPYVKVGDVITAGQVVCIIEAMKLFNEIEADISGKIVKMMVEDAQPVEYDQVLFLVDPKG
jgi:acetyl-CoA carboxylase biotin carboxyl carrier protein